MGIPDPPPPVPNLEANTDHGSPAPVPQEHPEDRVGIDFSCPKPPKSTANFDYEFSVALWRENLTRLAKSNALEIRAYRREEQERHKETIRAIRSIGSWWGGAWEAVKVCTAGTLEIIKTLASNENGQLKYFALTLVALAAIANGVAFSSSLFSAESATKCGRGTELHDGRCEVVLDGSGDAELIEP